MKDIIIENTEEETNVDAMELEIDKKAEFKAKAWNGLKKFGKGALLVGGGILVGILASGSDDCSCDVEDDEDFEDDDYEEETEDDSEE